MSNDNLDLQNVKINLNNKYKNTVIHDITKNEDGSTSIILSGDESKINSALNNINKPSFRELPSIDKEDVSKLVRNRYTTASSVIRRDAMGPSYMDLSVKPSVSSATPQDMYARSMEYYKTEDVYGSAIDALTNFASKGFTNDIDDPNIKNFFDNWVVDTGFDDIVDKIFFEVFRSGFVRTFKAVGKYIPKINYVSSIPGQTPKKTAKSSVEIAPDTDNFNLLELAAKKIKWSSSYIPTKYTILNPTMIEIEKSSILMDDEIVLLKSEALENIKEILELPKSELTEAQKEVINNLPKEFKNAALKGESVPLNPYLVGAVNYRKQPYERYPYPRGARAFESMEYKKSLRQADYSTLDGITNYVLVVTIGNDEYPVRSQDQLEAVADLFNTPSKAFNVVWDHTLKVNKIEPSDVGDILGQDKYKQVNEDITGAFGVIRSIIDGVGDPSKAGADLAVKSLLEEIYYVRKQVKRWIYKEYRDVAEAMSFDRFPKVRFDSMILKDEIMMMTVLQGMLDRRIMSYRSGLEQLGLNYESELAQMQEEKELVLDGTLGIIGSPYNSKAQPTGGDNIQEKQRTPNGTPSEGRPKGKPAKTPEKKGVKTPPALDKQDKIESSIGPVLSEMGVEDLHLLTQYIRETLLKRLDEDGE